MGYNPEFLNRPRKRQSPEANLVRQIIIYLKARGFVAGKIKTMGVRRGHAFCFDPYLWRGCPDILAFIPQLIFIEAKSLSGRQSDEQRAFQNYCNIANIPYYLIHSLEELQKVIL